MPRLSAGHTEIGHLDVARVFGGESHFEDGVDLERIVWRLPAFKRNDPWLFASQPSCDPRRQGSLPVHGEQDSQTLGRRHVPRGFERFGHSHFGTAVPQYAQNFADTFHAANPCFPTHEFEGGQFRRADLEPTSSRAAIAQGPIDCIEVESVRVEGATDPNEHAVVLIMLRIADSAEEFHVATDAADVLWWSGAFPTVKSGQRCAVLIDAISNRVLALNCEWSHPQGARPAGLPMLAER